MKVITEIKDFFEFLPWSGGKETMDRMKEVLDIDEIEMIFDCIDNCYPDGIGETTLNDILWFDHDFLIECVGWDFFSYDSKIDYEREVRP